LPGEASRLAVSLVGEGANLTTALITGANKGLGYRTAQRLIAAGHDVWLTARDPGSGRQAASELNARFVQLNVTDETSVAAAALVVAGSGPRHTRAGGRTQPTLGSRPLT